MIVRSMDALVIRPIPIPSLRNPPTQENNRLERQWQNYSRLNALLAPLVAELSLDPDGERALRNPARHLEMAVSNGLSDSQASELVAERVDALVAAARRVQRALALLEGREVTTAVMMQQEGGGGLGGLEEMAAALAVRDGKGRGQGPQQQGQGLLLPPPILINPAGGGGGGVVKGPGTAAVLLPGGPLPSPMMPGQSPAPQRPQPQPQLKAIPRRLMGMEALRAQGGRLAEVRAEFVEKASKYVAGLFPKFVRPEELPGE